MYEIGRTVCSSGLAGKERRGKWAQQTVIWGVGVHEPPLQSFTFAPVAVGFEPLLCIKLLEVRIAPFVFFLSGNFFPYVARRQNRLVLKRDKTRDNLREPCQG